MAISSGAREGMQAFAGWYPTNQEVFIARSQGLPGSVHFQFQFMHTPHALPADKKRHLKKTVAQSQRLLYRLHAYTRTIYLCDPVPREICDFKTYFRANTFVMSGSHSWLIQTKSTFANH
jgi:hypothetical protein